MLKLLGLVADLVGISLSKFGPKLTGAGLFIVGAIIAAPFFGIPVYVAEGFGCMIFGIGVFAFWNMWAKSEAEKRIENRNLPSSSTVPVIQTEITKLTNGK